MAKLEPVVYAASVDSIESRKRKGNRVPLPYLIRPRRIFPVYDSVSLYNDYLEYSSIKDGSDSQSDDDDSSMKNAVETSSLEKGDCFGLQIESNAYLSEMGHSLKDEKDEEYVIVYNVEALPNFKTERAGAIQMMELSKDVVDASESEDEGSNSDDWVVV